MTTPFTTFFVISNMIHLTKRIRRLWEPYFIDTFFAKILSRSLLLCNQDTRVQKCRQKTCPLVKKYDGFMTFVVASMSPLVSHWNGYFHFFCVSVHFYDLCFFSASHLIYCMEYVEQGCCQNGIVDESDNWYDKRQFPVHCQQRQDVYWSWLSWLMEAGTKKNFCVHTFFSGRKISWEGSSIKDKKYSMSHNFCWEETWRDIKIWYNGALNLSCVWVYLIHFFLGRRFMRKAKIDKLQKIVVGGPP